MLCFHWNFVITYVKKHNGTNTSEENADSCFQTCS